MFAASALDHQRALVQAESCAKCSRAPSVATPSSDDAESGNHTPDHDRASVGPVGQISCRPLLGLVSSASRTNCPHTGRCVRMSDDYRSRDSAVAGCELETRAHGRRPGRHRVCHARGQRDRGARVRACDERAVGPAELGPWSPMTVAAGSVVAGERGRRSRVTGGDATTCCGRNSQVRGSWMPARPVSAFEQHSRGRATVLLDGRRTLRWCSSPRMTCTRVAPAQLSLVLAAAASGDHLRRDQQAALVEAGIDRAEVGVRHRTGFLGAPTVVIGAA